jgi:hypothetical protein
MPLYALVRYANKERHEGITGGQWCQALSPLDLGGARRKPTVVATNTWKKR